MRVKRLSGLVLLLLAGCTTTHDRAVPAPSASTDQAFQQIENEFDVRLGVWALDTSTNRVVSWRANERFAFVSTFKALACAAVLRRESSEKLDDVITYSHADLVTHSPITQKHVGRGMTALAICDAAIRYSDNTAGNLLLRQLGGPAGFNASLREIGDETTYAARVEPDLNSAVPGDERDTSTASALGTDLMKFAVGDALPGDKRTLLQQWLQANTTGAKLIRAGVPRGWKVGDKTGAGGYGTRNNIAVVWPPGRAPIVLAVLSTHDTQDAAYSDAVIAQAARVVTSELA